MEHRYKVGDEVHLNFKFLDLSGSGRYQVIRLIPAGIDGEPQYRVKGEDGVERAIGERQMAAASKDEEASRSEYRGTAGKADHP